MLWRASISSHWSFEYVRLGNKYEKMALDVLRKPELDREELFPVFVFRFKEGGKLQRVFIDPIPYRFPDIKMYKFVFAGYSFHIKVDSRQLPAPVAVFSRLFLKPDNELVILEKTPEEEASDMHQILEGYKRLESAHKLRHKGRD